MLEAYAPILLVNFILCILPFILKFIAEYYERFKFTSEVQQVVFRRYLMFEWANIWLALVSGTIWTLLKLLAEEPMTVLEFIAAIMPQAAVYFVEMIIMKLMLVLPFEISRLWPWFRIEFVRRGFKDRLTDRDLASGAFEPPEFRYGFQYPSKLMVLTYAFVFARAAKGCEILNFEGSYLCQFPLVSAHFWTSDHLSSSSRTVNAFSDRIDR